MPDVSLSESHQPVIAVHVLRHRASFVRASKQGRQFATPSFIMLAVEDAELPTPQSPYIRVGYTVTRKQGGAVVRNRIKRRLREAVRMASGSFAPNMAYVLIARKKALLCPHSELIRDIRFAAGKIMKMPQRGSEPKTDGRP
jgi:ribonuclease P protein component